MLGGVLTGKKSLPWSGLLLPHLERGERLDKPQCSLLTRSVSCLLNMLSALSSWTCSYEIMKQCWDREPEQRLTFSELVTVISTSLESMSGYLQLDFITPSITAEKPE